MSAAPWSGAPVALTIAGSDSGGGAGIQADLKAFSALGVYGASVLTALTAQNTRAVTAVHDVPAAFVSAQLEAVLTDLPIGAVKIGMLSQAAVITAVTEALVRRPGLPVVLDPVMVAKSGAALLSPDAVDALRRELVPRATLLTPNYPEAAVLLGTTEESIRDAPERACTELRRLGAAAVILKGGHAGGPSSDDLLDDGAGLLRLVAGRVVSRNTHGTGCTFSAAIAAGLAHGLEPRAATRLAKRYVQGALLSADALRLARGSGSPDGRHGPVHHFFALWPSPPRHLTEAELEQLVPAASEPPGPAAPAVPTSRAGR